MSEGIPGSLLRALMCIALTIVAAVPIAACGVAGCPSGLLDGKVRLGPVSPVEQVGGPLNTRPYEATIDVETLGGDVVASVRSGKDGTFSVRLKAGSYRLVPRTPEGRPFPHAPRLNATVVAGMTTTVTVTYDSGIR